MKLRIRGLMVIWFIFYRGKKKMRTRALKIHLFVSISIKGGGCQILRFPVYLKSLVKLSLGCV